MGVAMGQHLEHAIALKTDGNYDEALAALKEILAEYPDQSAVHHQLGLVYGFIGEFDASLEALDQAVQLDGADLTVRIDLAKTHAMLGMYEEAKTGFEYVLAIEPDNEAAKYNLSFF